MNKDLKPYEREMLINLLSATYRMVSALDGLDDMNIARPSYEASYAAVRDELNAGSSEDFKEGLRILEDNMTYRGALQKLKLFLKETK